jgi:hypothetical protein
MRFTIIIEPWDSRFLRFYWSGIHASYRIYLKCDSNFSYYIYCSVIQASPIVFTVVWFKLLLLYYIYYSAVQASPIVVTAVWFKLLLLYCIFYSVVQAFLLYLLYSDSGFSYSIYCSAI